MDRHYDLTYLNQVFHGNESMVQEIVQLFLSQAPQFGQDMNACIRQSRWSDLHPLAHKLKSSVNMLGMAGQGVEGEPRKAGAKKATTTMSAPCPP